MYEDDCSSSSYSSSSSEDEKNENLDKIDKNLYLGNTIAGGDNEEIKDLGITLVISLESSTRRFLDNCKLKRIPIRDAPDEDILSHLNQCYDLIENEIKNQGKVLIHCRAGVSRSATVVIGYIMKKNNISMRSAYELVKKKRPKIKPNKGFIAQLQFWQCMNYQCDINNNEYRQFVFLSLINSLLRHNPCLSHSHSHSQYVTQNSCLSHSHSHSQYVTQNSCLSHSHNHSHSEYMTQIHCTPVLQYFNKLKINNKSFENSEYLCANCCVPLFDQVNVIINSPYDIFDKQAINMLQSFCKYVYIEPAPWMLPYIVQKNKGIIRCHKCSHKLGLFNWETNPCDCFIHTEIDQRLIFRIKFNKVKKISSELNLKN